MLFLQVVPGAEIARQDLLPIFASTDPLFLRVIWYTNPPSRSVRNLFNLPDIIILTDLSMVKAKTVGAKSTSFGARFLTGIGALTITSNEIGWHLL